MRTVFVEYVYTTNYDLVDLLGEAGICMFTGILDIETVNYDLMCITFKDMMNAFAHFKSTEVYYASVIADKFDIAKKLLKKEGYSIQNNYIKVIEEK